MYRTPARSTLPVVSHGLAMRSTPANPISTPRVLNRVTRSLLSMAAAVDAGGLPAERTRDTGGEEGGPGCECKVVDAGGEQRHHDKMMYVSQVASV